MNVSIDILDRNLEGVLISVIVPVYNVKDYLPTCIESLLAQTHKNIEVIIVDDGSTDDSGLIIDEYARSDKRIKAIHTMNGGFSAARNIALDVAIGDYFMFVDSDDYVENDFCEQALSIAIEHQVEVVSFGYIEFWTESEKRLRQSTREPRLLNKHDAIKELIDRQEILFNMPCNKIFARHLFDGMRFIEGRTFEDMAIMHLVFDRVKTGIYISDVVLYNYRQARAGSTMANSTTPKMLNDRFLNEYDRLQFIRENYPDLESNQIHFLTEVCLWCYIYLPKKRSVLNNNEIENFMKANKTKILAAFSGLRRFRLQSYYALPILFRLINFLLRRYVYHAG